MTKQGQKAPLRHKVNGAQPPSRYDPQQPKRLLSQPVCADMLADIWECPALFWVERMWMLMEGRARWSVFQKKELWLGIHIVISRNAVGFY